MGKPKPKKGDPTAMFNTPLSPEDKVKFSLWLINQSLKMKRPIHNDLENYDLQGWFKKNGAKDLTGAHLNDEFKKPNHPTFSNESIYSGTTDYLDNGQPYNGGQWIEDPANKDKWSYKPSQEMMQTVNQKQLADYFKKVEPGNQLLWQP